MYFCYCVLLFALLPPPGWILKNQHFICAHRWRQPWLVFTWMVWTASCLIQRCIQYRKVLFILFTHIVNDISLCLSISFCSPSLTLSPIHNSLKCSFLRRLSAPLSFCWTRAPCGVLQHLRSVWSFLSLWSWNISCSCFLLNESEIWGDGDSIGSNEKQYSVYKLGICFGHSFLWQPKGNHFLTLFFNNELDHNLFLCLKISC